MTTTDLQQGGASRLDDWGVIRAEGADAAAFLHGQLTQDVSGLGAGQARLAGYCSAKGRLLATFVIWRPVPDEVLLACSADVLPVVLKRLSMFVLRAKCKLSDASTALPLWGLAGPAAGQALPNAAGAAWTQALVNGATLTRLPDAAVADGGVDWPRWLCAGAPPELPVLPAALWRALEARSAVARVVAATSEQFVPQMINFEVVGGVNFQKGCYPGQEVVARSQYRGTIKRRAMLFDAAEMLVPGQEVFHSADATQPAGMVVLAGGGGTGAQPALIEVKLGALADGTLHAGRADGPVLTPRPLPYALPTEAA